MNHCSLQLSYLRNNGILALTFENGPLYNLAHVKLVVIIQRHHSNGLKVIPINYNVRKFIIVEPNVEIPTRLTHEYLPIV